MKYYILFIVLTLPIMVFGQLKQESPCRKINNVTWDISLQLEYFKSVSYDDSTIPTLYYIKTNGSWLTTNVTSKISWIHVNGRVNKIDVDKKMLFVESFDATKKRWIPSYCLSSYPHDIKTFEQIQCVAFYSTTNEITFTIQDGLRYQCIDYGIPDYKSEIESIERRKNENTVQITFTKENVKYKKIYGKFTWQEAVMDSNKRGGHLATITSQSEWERLIKETGLLENEEPRFWLGGTDVIKNGEWRWITGEPYIWSNWDSLAPKRIGEPNDGRIMNYTVTWNGYKWNDYGNIPDCLKAVTGYILEIE